VNVKLYVKHFGGHWVCERAIKMQSIYHLVMSPVIPLALLSAFQGGSLINSLSCSVASKWSWIDIFNVVQWERFTNEF